MSNSSKVAIPCQPQASSCCRVHCSSCCRVHCSRFSVESLVNFPVSHCFTPIEVAMKATPVSLLSMSVAVRLLTRVIGSILAAAELERTSVALNFTAVKHMLRYVYTGTLQAHSPLYSVFYVWRKELSFLTCRHGLELPRPVYVYPLSRTGLCCLIVFVAHVCTTICRLAARRRQVSNDYCTRHQRRAVFRVILLMSLCISILFTLPLVRFGVWLARACGVLSRRFSAAAVGSSRSGQASFDNQVLQCSCATRSLPLPTSRSHLPSWLGSYPSPALHPARSPV